MSTQDPYRLGSLGDLVELLVDGWAITEMHYSETCSEPGHEDAREAAFISLSRPDAGAQALYIPDDDRAFSHRALLAVFRESPHIWKFRSPETIRRRLEEGVAPDRPEPASWQDIADPADLRLDATPETLLGVVAVGQVESIADVTVALLSIERYADFARVRYLAHTADPDRHGSLGALDVLVVDDRGRIYRSATAAVERAGGRMEGVLSIVPAIPRDVTGLTVTIGAVGRGPEGGLGPWVFPIALPTPPR